MCFNRNFFHLELLLHLLPVAEIHLQVYHKELRLYNNVLMTMQEFYYQLLKFPGSVNALMRLSLPKLNLFYKATSTIHLKAYKRQTHEGRVRFAIEIRAGTKEQKKKKGGTSKERRDLRNPPYADEIGRNTRERLTMRIKPAAAAARA
ncbi:hypothetical protein EVAR_39038_1 [Eumeta japonica]|uniref:Uncharacterized protein n=1 Tax=Eumeta variegata TaxID=151549 RepID=A0A4C1WRX8_EUMVA|nr:hypothetical protein EVAR_39038_1 [Eumeta japonica]